MILRAVLLLLLGGSLAGCAGVGVRAEHEATGVAATADREVIVFGPPNRSGTLPGGLSSGQSIGYATVPDFATRPGQAFFFPTVTSDGTLFIANMTQTISELALTGCEMVITCFNPEQATCFDDRSGEPAHFSNLRVPAASGSLGTPSTCPSGLRSEVPPVEGAEVDDLEVAVDEHGVERVLFDSFDGSVGLPPAPNQYPMFGSLWKQNGAWRVDPSSLRYPGDLIASSSQGPVACPAGSCGATTEMARLPASNRIVVNQYVSGVVMVVDLGGRVLGSYQVDAPHDWCDPSVTEPYVASLRQVNADPTSALGDERFVVVYEGWGPTGQHAQEFSYNELEPVPSERVRPITAPFQPDSPFHPAPTCGHGRTALSAIYDDLGNLWLSSLDRDGARKTASLVVLHGDGRRRLERECSFLDPATGKPRPWGTVCETDLDVGALGAGIEAGWSFPSLLLDAVLDPASGTLFAVLAGGQVYPIERRDSGDGGFVFLVGDGLDPHPERLAPLEPTAQRRFVARGAVDSVRRALWLPLGSQVAYEALDKDYYVGQQLEQYVYRVDLDRAFASGIEVYEVAAPASAPAGADLVLSVRATAPPPLRSARSFVALYAPGSSAPIATAGWSQGDCEQATCRFSASIAGAATAGRPGVYRWHAGLVSGAKRVHLIGRVVVE